MKAWIRWAAGCLYSVSCGAAFAAVQVVHCTAPAAPTELNLALHCDQFSPSGGTLTSISIELSGHVTGNISLTNNSSIQRTASATTFSEFTVTSIASFGPGDFPASGFSWSNPLFTASLKAAFVNMPAFQTPNATSFTTTDGSATLLDTTQFDPYLGAGTFDIGVTTLTGVTIFPTGGVDTPLIPGQENTTATVSAIVTYTFVPEPAMVSLFAVGLLALVWVHRRRAVAIR